MKRNILYILIGLSLGITGSVYAQIEEKEPSASSSTTPIVVKEVTLQEKYDNQKIYVENIDVLVSKYAMLYDGCKNK